MAQESLDRRSLLGRILAAVVGLPVVGFLLASVSPLLRVLRPTLDAWGVNQPPDKPAGGDQQVAILEEFPEDWAFKDFTFFLRNFEYTPRATNISLVPGFAVKVPKDLVDSALKEQGPELYKAATEGGNEGILLFSRICPHLGCIFNYFSPKREAEWQVPAVHQRYGYPGARVDQAYFACPCHFSVYDLKQVGKAGNGDPKLGLVVSGPAQRPPRSLTFAVREGKIFVQGMEAGSVS